MSGSATTMKLQQKRATMIRGLVGVLEGRGYGEIRVARLEEYAGFRPAVILWESSDEAHLPDITAQKGRNDFLFQVEPGEALDAEAESRMILFAAYARHYRRHFCLVVPAENRRSAKDIMRALQVDERFAHVLGM